MILLKKREGTRRARPLLGLAIILASFALGGYLWLQSAERMQKQRIAHLEGLAERLKSETVPVKFMVLSRDGGQIKARVKLFDLSGKEVTAIEKSWPGSELYVDILLLPFSSSGEREGRADEWLALPYRLFTDSLPAASGTFLFDAYEVGGFPEVLRGIDWKPAEAAAIKAAYSKARKRAAKGLPAADSSEGSFGSAVHEAARIASFEQGVVYKVVCRVKGGVEIAEE
jgi:hypothetical protein